MTDSVEEDCRGGDAFGVREAVELGDAEDAEQEREGIEPPRAAENGADNQADVYYPCD